MDLAPGRPLSGTAARRGSTMLRLAIALLSCPAPGLAGSLPEPLGSMAQRADLVAAGECTSESSGWNEHGFITTTVRFRLLRVFKGPLREEVTVKTLGGRVGSESMTASHGATLAAGEVVLLFLTRSEFGDYFVVAGGDQGKIAITAVPPDWPAAPSAGTQAEFVRLWTDTTAH